MQARDLDARNGVSGMRSTCIRKSRRDASERTRLLAGTRFANGIDPALTIEHARYTPAKMMQLIRHYVHEESRAKAVEQWRLRRVSKTSSVGFHTYNHLLKAERRHGVGSVMGPCKRNEPGDENAEAAVHQRATRG